MEGFAQDQCIGNPLRYLGPLLQFPCFWGFLVTVQRAAISRAVVVRALPDLLKAQLLVRMDASLFQSVSTVG